MPYVTLLDGGWDCGPKPGKKNWLTPLRSWREILVLFLLFFHN